MLTLNCASCGAPVQFRSKASVFAVCSFCKSTLVRHDMNLEAVGKMAELQDDYSPFQIGTTGFHNGEKFEMVGRLRVSYSEGFWNEWFLWFQDDKVGWLAEAQGFLAICFPGAEQVPDSYALSPGTVVPLQGCPFHVDDMRQVRCLYSEGELPVNAVKDRVSLSVDLSGPDLMMATIEYARDPDISKQGQPRRSAPYARLFIGNYADFDSFKFANLRKLDGW